MECQKARVDDFNAVQSVYDDIIEKTADMEKYARWKKGLHPTDASIMEYIRHGGKNVHKHSL